MIANPDVPAKIENEAEELGRVTVGMAKALKAKVLVTAASPLFNGNMDYEVIADNRGVKIFNPVKTEEEKKQKWVKAAEACKEAITYLEDLGFGLYYFDDPTVVMTESDKLMMNLRGAVTEKWNGQTLSHGSVRVLMTTIRYRQCRVTWFPAEMLRMLRTEPIWVFLLD